MSFQGFRLSSFTSPSIREPLGAGLLRAGRALPTVLPLWLQGSSLHPEAISIIQPPTEKGSINDNCQSEFVSRHSKNEAVFNLQFTPLIHMLKTSNFYIFTIFHKWPLSKRGSFLLLCNQDAGISQRGAIAIDSLLISNLDHSSPSECKIFLDQFQAGQRLIMVA